MSKKVYELAKEMGISSKELAARAAEKGIAVKSHMSVLSDDDVKALVEVGPASGKQPPKHSPMPNAKPIVNNDMLAKRKQAPVGKPVVDESMFANREKSHSEEPKSQDVKKPAPQAETKPEAKPETKPETKPEPKAETKPESKAETKAEAKPAAEPQKSAPTEPAADKAPKASKKNEAPKETSAPKEKSDPKQKAEPKEKKPEKAAPNAEKDAKSEEGKASPKKVKSKPKKVRGIPEIKIKIVKPAAQVQREEAERKERDEKRRQQKKSDSRRARNGRKPAAQQGEGTARTGRRKKDEASGETQPARGGRRESRGGESRTGRVIRPESAQNGGNRSSRRHGRKDRFEDGGRDKFSRFEHRSLQKKERKKYTKPAKQQEEEVEEEVLPEGTIRVNVPITVAGFCEQANVSVSTVIMSLMKLGIMANINQNIDEDTLLILAEDLGLKVVIGEVETEEEEEGIEDFKDNEKDLEPRPPVITVMGHVDHGKTSLLDAIRNTNVTAKESGGITQHIGASEVWINGQKIVFLDTPGHEAFTAMRARGAHITDIAVLVVAADDSVKPQTIESISHAKAANVPIIVAINKMDKPGANPDRVKKDLADNGVLVEDWGGNVISVPVSAKTGEGIENLLEMILLQAEMLELKANPKRLAKGSVIEARLDKSRGPVATLLVMNGTLQAGQSIVAGTCSGRIRLMTDYKGKKIKKAKPATAVEILGLTDVPQAGDEFNVVRDDKTAREIAEHRQEKLREETMTKASGSGMTLEKMFSQMKEGEVKELNVIIKGDVQGSVGALISSLEKLNNEEVKVNVIHSGVGTVNESDVMLAETSGAVIIGFNVRPSTAVTTQAENAGVEIRLYRVIYDVINDVEAAMKGMLEPEFKEEILGKAEIRDTFKVPGVGIIGGAYVTEGKVVRNAEIRLVRDGIVIHEGKISSLKRYKDDAKEVAQGYECGIGIEDYNDIKEGDTLECFHMVETERE